MSAINGRRRVVINRSEIVYGQTPIGLRRKELERMAAEQNVDISTLCRKIIYLTSKERFAFIKNYYHKLNEEVNEFFTNFDNYEIRSMPETHKQNQEQLNHENSEGRERSRKQFKGSTLRNNGNESNTSSHRECNFIKPEESEINSTLISVNNAASEEFLISFNQSTSTSARQCNDLYNNSIINSSINQSPIPCNIKKTSNAEYSDKYESVISSLFNDSDNKLKKIVRAKANKNKSPKKYNTIMESLLFG